MKVKLMEILIGLLAGLVIGSASVFAFFAWANRNPPPLDG